MALAFEPCLYQYFIYLVKDKGKLDSRSISESQGLWDSICKVLEFDDESPRLSRRIKKSSDEIYLSKLVKRLATFKADDGLVLGEQILAHDMLVLCFVINSEENLKTNTPEETWHKQLEVSSLSKDLKHIYNSATVLQTITRRPKTVAATIQKQLPGFITDKVGFTEFEFGKLFRFGNQLKFLLAIEKKNEDFANKFLANNFAYILTLLSKIENHYLLAVKLYKEISKQEELMNRLEVDLKDSVVTEDPQLLKNKIVEVRAVNKDTTSNLTYLRDCGSNIQSNIINLQDAIKDFNILNNNDSIFKSNQELYAEHVENINSWVNVCESTLMRINRTTYDLQSDLKEQLEKLSLKSGESVDGQEPLVLKSLTEIPQELGNCYIINENEFGKSLGVFKHFLKNNNNGLCITRTHPDKLRKSCEIPGVSIMWLSKDDCDLCIPPVLEKISHTIMDFYRGHENSVVILDGLEYLKTNNDFNRILKFIDHLKDVVFMYKCTFILPINFKIFPEDELALIKKNMIEIRISL